MQMNEGPETRVEGPELRQDGCGMYEVGSLVVEWRDHCQGILTTDNTD
jgi:hypothetical protein